MISNATFIGELKSTLAALLIIILTFSIISYLSYILRPKLGLIKSPSTGLTTR